MKQLLLVLFLSILWSTEKMNAQPQPLPSATYGSGWVHSSSNTDLLWDDILGFNLEGEGVIIGTPELVLEGFFGLEGRVLDPCVAPTFHGTQGGVRAAGSRSGDLLHGAGSAPKASIRCSQNWAYNSDDYNLYWDSLGGSAGSTKFDLVADRYFTYFQAAGNHIGISGLAPDSMWYKLDTFGTLDGKGSNKNVISMGAAFGIGNSTGVPADIPSLPGRYDEGNIPNTQNFFTSQGPTTLVYQGDPSLYNYDGPPLHSQGRIKPDLVIANRADLHTQTHVYRQRGIFWPDSLQQVAEEQNFQPGMLINNDYFKEGPNLGFVAGGLGDHWEKRGGLGLHSAYPPAYDSLGVLIRQEGYAATFAGTSAAAPAAAGVNALLEELRIRHGHSDYLSSTWKAILIHSAFEMGSWDGPDYKQGWGMINAPGAAHLVNLRDVTLNDQSSQISKHGMVIEGSFPTNNSQFDIQHDGNGPFKATLAWIDSESDLELVNDLDILVHNMDGGSWHFPFLLDPEEPHLPPTRGKDSNNNVEQVYIPQSEANAGTYRVYIFSNLQEPSQDFSLVVSTYGTADPCGPNWELDNLSYNASRHFQSPDYIKSADTVVDAGASDQVTFLAGNEVVLEPGFIAEDNFVAGIKECVIPDTYMNMTAGTPIAGGKPKFSVRSSSDLEDLKFGLEPNYPNPFTKSTRIGFSIESANNVKLEIFDLTGRKINTLVDRQMQAGKHSVDWEVDQMPAGTYIYSLQSGSKIEHRTMILIK